VEEILDLSPVSHNLSVDFSTSYAGVVARPAVDCSINLAIEFAHVVLVEDLHGVSLASEAVFFVAGFASFGFFGFIQKFFHSVDVSLLVAFAANGSEDSLSVPNDDSSSCRSLVGGC